MNYKVLKDKKVVIGLISAMVLAITAILLAIYDISYWVLSSGLSIVILYSSRGRADRIMKDDSKS